MKNKIDNIIIQSAKSADMDEIFDLQVKNISALIEHYLYSDNKRTALIVDSASPQLVHSLRERKSGLLSTLKTTLSNPRGSDLPAALEIALNEFNTNSQNTEEKKNLLIMLDRKLPKEADITMNKIKENGIRILFVLYGTELDKKDIKELEEKGMVLFKPGQDGDIVRDIVNSLEGETKTYGYFFS